MTAQELAYTAHRPVGSGTGLLAMDESNPTCDKRFASVGIPQTEEARRTWRKLLVTTPALADNISGAILYGETIRERTKDGRPFVKVLTGAGIIPGIKVDTGAKDLAGHRGEKVTEGLDGLRVRLRAYFQMGARFAKWRAVISVGDKLPSRGCIDANAHALARYVALCQRVSLEGMNLKPNMVLPGLNCPKQQTVIEVAAATVTCFLRIVPAPVPGIAFLSGGQAAELTSVRLDAINLIAKSAASRPLWPLAFSFARAIHQPALEIWRGQGGHVAAAQRVLADRARFNRAALHCTCTAAMGRA